MNLWLCLLFSKDIALCFYCYQIIDFSIVLFYSPNEQRRACPEMSLNALILHLFFICPLTHNSLLYIEMLAIESEPCPHPHFLNWLLQRERERERERERNLLFHLFLLSLIGSSMCPDLELNLQLWHVR